HLTGTCQYIDVLRLDGRSFNEQISDALATNARDAEAPRRIRPHRRIDVLQVQAAVLISDAAQELALWVVSFLPSFQGSEEGSQVLRLLPTFSVDRPLDAPHTYPDAGDPLSLKVNEAAGDRHVFHELDGRRLDRRQPAFGTDKQGHAKAISVGTGDHRGRLP